MATRLPSAGEWYRDPETEQIFEIVAIDDVGFIEIQYLDGSLSEFDFDSWRLLSLSKIDQPEDSSSGYELNYEDRWGADAGWASANTANPLLALEPESFQGTEDF